MNNTTAFQVGTTYTTGEARDYVWHFEVIKRTAKFITIIQVGKNGRTYETKRVGVRVDTYQGASCEVAMPLGTYSMAPSITADDFLV